MYQWKKKWEHGEAPDDLDECVFTTLVDYWMQQKTKDISATSRENRMSDRGGKGVATQNGGPVSTEQSVEDLTQENGGVPPSLTLVMTDRHTNRKTGQITDKKALEILHAVEEEEMVTMTQRTQDESNESVPLTLEEKNQIFIKNNPSHKSRVYGINQELAYEHASFVFSAPPHLVQEIERLNQVIEDEKERLNQIIEDDREKHRKESEETLGKLARMDAIMRRRFPDEF